MIKTPVLESLANEIALSKVDWGRIVARYKEHPLFSSGNAFSLDGYAHAFRRIHLNEVLNRLVGSEKTTVTYLPLQVMDQEYYVYQNELGNVFAINKCTDDVRMYDAIVMDGDTPAIIKIKTCPWGKDLKEFFSERKYGRDKVPVASLFGKKPGYILIVSPEVYSARNSSNYASEETNWNNFLKEGGIIVPFPMRRDDFEKKASEEISRNGLLLK